MAPVHAVAELIAALCVSGDPVAVLFSRFEHRRFLRRYSSAKIYLNSFLLSIILPPLSVPMTMPAVVHE
jgi:hypothetical protein